MSRRLLPAVLLALLSASAPCGAASEGYTNTASLFHVESSVRAMGMGGAFLAVADAYIAASSNPAALPELDRRVLSSTVTRPFQAYAYGALGLADTGWGAQVVVLDSGRLTKRDPLGNPEGTFRHTEAGSVVAGGVAFGDELSLGLQVKLHLPGHPQRPLCASVSPALLLEDGPRSYGIVWRDVLAAPLGVGAGNAEPRIPNLAVGFAWRSTPVLLAIDFTEQLFTRGDISSVRAGVETAQFHPLILRAGTHWEGTSFGASLHWNELRLDIAYVLHYSLPHSYYLSLSHIW